MQTRIAVPSVILALAYTSALAEEGSGSVVVR